MVLPVLTISSALKLKTIAEQVSLWIFAYYILGLFFRALFYRSNFLPCLLIWWTVGVTVTYSLPFSRFISPNFRFWYVFWWSICYSVFVQAKRNRFCFAGFCLSFWLEVEVAAMSEELRTGRRIAMTKDDTGCCNGWMKIILMMPSWTGFWICGNPIPVRKKIILSKDWRIKMWCHASEDYRADLSCIKLFLYSRLKIWRLGLLYHQKVMRKFVRSIWCEIRQAYVCIARPWAQRKREAQIAHPSIGTVMSEAMRHTEPRGALSNWQIMDCSDHVFLSSQHQDPVSILNLPG